MKATLSTIQQADVPEKEGVFALFRGEGLIHYTSATNLRRGVFLTLSTGWKPTSILLVETEHGLSLERYLRRKKWDGSDLTPWITEWEKKWEEPQSSPEWEAKLAPGGKLIPKCPDDPEGRKVWHRLAKAETKRLLEEIDSKPKV